MSASAIYEGTVRHRRFGATPYAFRHGIALPYVDLDELPRLLGGALAAPRPGAVRFRRGDYHGDPAVPLADAVRGLVAERTGVAVDGPVRLLAHLRSFGHCFNPVAFYYCFDRDEALRAVVAEVTNTPWGERHAYVLAHAGTAAVLRGGVDKALHVSPFLGMDFRYEWRATDPGRTLSVHIENHRAGERAFDATLSLRRRPLTRRTLAAVTARYPAATLRVLALIYAHGLRLRLKGARVHPHARPEAR